MFDRPFHSSAEVARLRPGQFYYRVRYRGEKRPVSSLAELIRDRDRPKPRALHHITMADVAAEPAVQEKHEKAEKKKKGKPEGGVAEVCMVPRQRLERQTLADLSNLGSARCVSGLRRLLPSALLIRARSAKRRHCTANLVCVVNSSMPPARPASCVHRGARPHLQQALRRVPR